MNVIGLGVGLSSRHSVTVMVYGALARVAHKLRLVLAVDRRCSNCALIQGRFLSITGRLCSRCGARRAESEGFCSLAWAWKRLTFVKHSTTKRRYSGKSSEVDPKCWTTEPRN